MNDMGRLGVPGRPCSFSANETPLTTHFEITGGIIRQFRGDFGTPFENVVYVVGDRDTAILKGLRIEKPTIEEGRDLLRCLAQEGFKRVAWDRYKNGKPIRLSLSLDRFAGRKSGEGPTPTR